MQDIGRLILGLVLGLLLGGGIVFVLFYLRRQKANLLAQEIIEEAKNKALEIKEKAQKEIEERRAELSKIQSFLQEKEAKLYQKESELEEERKRVAQQKEELEQERKKARSLIEELQGKLEKIAQLSKEEAKEEIMRIAEREAKEEIKERLRKLEAEGEERFKERAKEILATTIQRLASSYTGEVTTTIVHLPSEDLKGKIIGKEGRNIKHLERLTGVDIIIDETPETLIISGFNPVRRQIAKLALERLIKDGRIHPATIEKEVERAEKEIEEQMQKMGEMALQETGVVGLDPRLVKLLGKLYFRTSYGQNVLLHSIEVSLLAGYLAAELGANVGVAKKAGLLHDIGKALDQEMEGSHVEIGIKILEKFGVEPEVITAMKSHHDDYPHETVEAIIVQTADKISGSRPGARSDNLENYVKRLEDLEKLALEEEGVEKAYAIQGGRELRIFVTSSSVSDEAAEILAKKIARKIERNLRYPGEIRVVVIREKRFVEVAR